MPAQHGFGREATVVAVGAFGEAVARFLEAPTAELPDVVGPRGEGTRPVVLAAWRFSRSAARALDRRVDGTWVPVTYLHPTIQVGPVFAPGLPGCHECLESRLLDNDSRPEYVTALWNTYDQSPEVGPRGYLEHHALVAAGLAQVLMGEEPRPVRGVYTSHVLSGETERHDFVPRPGCSRWEGVLR
ncbi:TOMM precursor leader peptide-binding protein [Streptomyces sp. NPDC050388]|uniref:TOMM precursor leader peptide-binding protein n=1 Tax=Streptomyces sp. NPDC050388 TaxID=3155781 RepID=UPI003427D7CE